MNLLFIADTPPFPLEATKRALLFYLARELSTQRHTLDLLCFYDEPEDLAQLPRYQRFFRTVELIRKPSVLAQSLKKRTRQKRFFPNNASEGWSPPMWNMVERLINERRYDFVHFVGDILVYEYLPLIQDLANLIVTDQLPAHRAREMAALRRLPRHLRNQQQQHHKIYSQYQQAIYTPFQHVIVATDGEAKTFSRIRPYQLPMGVDVDYYIPTGHDPQHPALLLIGDYQNPILAQAAHTLAYDILPDLRKLFPDMVLYLVGANLPPDFLKLGDHIIAPGYVQDLRPYFELASVFVCPLPQAMGFRVDILKAMAMMTPVVASPAAMSGLNFKDGQDYLAAETPTDFTRLITRLLNEHRLRQTLQLTAHEKVQKHYAWQVIAKRYLELYNTK